MFKNLRNKFVLINVLTTSAILIISYATVFLVAKNSAESRMPIPAEETLDTFDQSQTYVRRMIEERILTDRKLALKNLLFVLIVTGISVEIIVFIFSLYLAEEAIKPVKEAYDTQKVFIANASHEIKTPIAAIKANLEAADLSSTNHWIKNIETEADKIETLNLALLKLAKTDAIKEALVSEPTELKPLVESTLVSFDSRLKKKNITLKVSYNLDDKKIIKLNSADYKEILEILTDNAIKYCNQKIWIQVTPKTLSIKNDGATIPKEKLAHIFDRFYQVDKSKSGSGLGLAIADSLAKRNNWSLKADSTNKTTTFTLGV
ncbi:HAMP domain-containing histidine kinase [Candidatus Saccharibacteria bacterium]|nr:HAMP domain-containing histidine kinase [Candidatus Saccharibacteria bacterium]